MKKSFSKRTKNQDLLIEFGQYCANHPDERFFQALRNWMKVRYIYISNDTVSYCPKIIDTFYFEGKNK